MTRLIFALILFSTSYALGNAQSTCSAPIAPSGAIRPSLASGYQVQVVATGLAGPRGIEFDSAGNLLIAEKSSGDLTALTFSESNGCVSVSSTTTVVSGSGLNHGLALSNDGKTLYASSSSDVWSWAYDSSSKTASNQQVIVTNMTTSDHTTRTLTMSQKVPGMLLVSRGSTSNIDFDAASLSSGHSQIRAFNLNNMTGTPYQFDTQGLRLGWGLRNSVGVAEHPTTGGIYSVENSADQVTRDGVDIHENNPGEEMNFHGYLNGTEYADQGKNYGYPWCFTAWDVSELPENSRLQVGDQFAIDATAASDNENRTDAFCAEQVAPRLTFQAHMAPIDIKFHREGTQAFVSFHGSWDRTDPIGYKVSVISFKNGEPVDGPHSSTSLTDIFANEDESVCPDSCFRPAGLTFDSKGRLFVSSDSSGEIYMITGVSTSTSTSGGPSPTSSSSGTSTFTSSAPSTFTSFAPSTSTSFAPSTSTSFAPSTSAGSGPSISTSSGPSISTSSVPSASTISSATATSSQSSSAVSHSPPCFVSLLSGIFLSISFWILT